MQPAVFLAFGAMLCWGVGDFLIQRSSRAIGVVRTIIWIGLIGILGMLPFVIIDIRLLAQTRTLPLLLALTCVSGLAAYLHYTAVRIGKLSVIEMLVGIEFPLTVLLGMLFFHETLTSTQVVLMSAIFIGIVVLSIDVREFAFEKGALLAITAACALATTNFLTASAAKQLTPWLAIWVPWTAFTVALVVYYVATQKPLVTTEFSWKFILIMAVIDTAAWVFYSFAVAEHPLGLTTAITISYPVLGVLLGVVFNRERIHWYQYLGAGLALACSVALAL